MKRLLQGLEEGLSFFTSSNSENDNAAKASQSIQMDVTVTSVKHFQYTSWTLGFALNIFSAFVKKHVCIPSLSGHHRAGLPKLCEEHVVTILLWRVIVVSIFFHPYCPCLTQENSNSDRVWVYA